MLIPATGSATVTDIDGNVYNTEQIGSQCWMKENLRMTKYKNDVPIFSGYYWYNNDISWKYLYGALYTWDVATNSNGLCPEGWHVPSDAELSQLTDFIGGGLTYGGRQLKSCRQISSPLGGNCDTDVHPRWDFNDTCHGTDDYGFAALPSGIRISSGDFWNLGTNANWWSSTENNLTEAWRQSIGVIDNNVERNSSNKSHAISIRCIKN